MATQITIKAPKNKRLSQYDRKRLNSFAKKLVEASQDHTAVDVAYANAATVVTTVIERQYPPKDMKVLVKYEAARFDKCIRLSPGFGEVIQFCFRDDDKAPLRPSVGGCRSHNYLMETDEYKIVSAFGDAEKAFKAAIEKRLKDYGALIGSVNSFNEVANVWPEAEELREPIVGSATALVLLSNDVVERIKADAASRQEAA